jgi:hypothetical protein
VRNDPARLDRNSREDLPDVEALGGRVQKRAQKIGLRVAGRCRPERRIGRPVDRFERLEHGKARWFYAVTRWVDI